MNNIEKYDLKVGDVLYCYQLEESTGKIIKRIVTICEFHDERMIIIDESNFTRFVYNGNIDTIYQNNFFSPVERSGEEMQFMFELHLSEQRRMLDRKHKKELKKMNELIEKVRRA